MVRVAVIQLESARDAAETLASCARQIDRAASEHAAGVIVFPELSLDDDDELTATGKLPALLIERSTRYQIWLLGSAQHQGLTSAIWASPSGEFSVRASSILEQTGSGSFGAEEALIETPHGKIGLCTGAAGLHFKVARSLSLAGADMVCVSLALRSDAELSRSAPARAVENQLVVAVAAHASVEPEPYALHLATLPPESDPAQQTERAPVSQIFAPLGQPLAHGPLGFAELELSKDVSSESAPGPRALVARRPDLYRGFPLRGTAHQASSTIAELDVAALAFSELGSVSDAIAWAREHLEELAEKEIGLAVLPELFCFDPNLTDLQEAAAADFLTVVQALARACKRSGMHVVTSLVEQVEDAFFHVGVLIGQRGIVLRQAQLHITDQYSWARPGKRLSSAHMPWGTLGLVVGADALVPELLDGLGRADVDLVAAPLSTRGARMSALTLGAAAVEAGYAVIAAARPAFADDAPQGEPIGASFVADPARWPTQRAEATQEVLRSTLRLGALREARRLAVKAPASRS